MFLIPKLSKQLGKLLKVTRSSLLTLLLIDMLCCYGAFKKCEAIQAFCGQLKMGDTRAHEKIIIETIRVDNQGKSCY